MEDRHHMENSPLSEIGGSRGARASSRNVERKRLGMQLDSFDVPLFIYPILVILCFGYLLHPWE